MIQESVFEIAYFGLSVILVNAILQKLGVKKKIGWNFYQIANWNDNIRNRPILDIHWFLLIP